MYFSRTPEKLGSETHALHIFGEIDTVMPHGLVTAIRQCRGTGASLDDIKSVVKSYIVDLAKESDLMHIFHTSQVDFDSTYGMFGAGSND